MKMDCIEQSDEIIEDRWQITIMVNGKKQKKLANERRFMLFQWNNVHQLKECWEMREVKCREDESLKQLLYHN